MLKEKEYALKDKIKNILNNIGYSNDVKQSIGGEFKRRNLNVYTAMQVLQGNLDLITLDDNEENIRFLFIFSYALSKALEQYTDLELNVEEYFTKVEVDKWKDYKEEKMEEDIFPIIFEDVQQVNGKMWQGVLSAQKIKQLRDSNVLIYNFKTQRDPKVTIYGERINLDKARVQEISKRLIQQKQYPDPLILNILNNEDVEFEFDQKNSQLIIYKGVINHIDGHHRIVANGLALEKMPNLNFNWQVTFTFLTEDEANDYITQKDKQRPMKKEYRAQKDLTKEENLVVDAITNDRLSQLADAIKDDDQYIKLNKALTKKSIIATAIKENYNEQLKTKINIRNIAKWIVEFTDELMGLYQDEFINNPYEVKKHSLINHKNMFYGYIALSEVLQNNPDWKQKLKEKMESVDFTSNNPIWDDIGINIDSLKDLNKSSRIKLYNFFKGGVV